MTTTNNRHTRTTTYSLQESTSLGKIMPQAPELEEAILGAIMIETEAFAVVENLLQADDFYLSAHQTIYRAIQTLSLRHEPIDMLTVVHQLSRMGQLEAIGGPVYIAQLTDKIGSAAHLDFHARIVKQKAQSRFLITLTSRVSAMAYDETQDVSTAIETLEQGFSTLSNHTTGFQSVDFNDALKASVDKASKTQAERLSGAIVAIPTGLEKLNHQLAGGWRSPDLIVIGGRPSMGKTQHALSFAKAAIEAGKHCCFVSIEMSATQLVNRYLLEDARIDSYHLHTGQMLAHEWEALDKQVQRFYNLPLHIADHHSIRYLNNIKSEARRLHRKKMLDMLIIDYLGLIRTHLKFQNRYLEIGYITGELKNLAKELDIPVMLLSQLSRPVKGSEVRHPQLEDLRESGDIEQDADIVLFIHKPDYYKADAATNGQSWHNKGILIIAKHREGMRNNAIVFEHDDRYKNIQSPQRDMDNSSIF